MLGLLAFRGYGARLGARPTEQAPAARVDLNRADRAELEQVPGIGSEKAKAIDSHRKLHGPFKSIDDLRGVQGFGPATLDAVRPYLRVDAPPEQPPLDPEPLVLARKPTTPTPAPPPRPSAGIRKIQPGEPPIDVNSASAEELQRLPGIGPVTANAIVAARPFKSVEDLDRVKGIGKKTLDKLRPFVVVK